MGGGKWTDGHFAQIMASYTVHTIMFQMCQLAEFLVVTIMIIKIEFST